MSELTEKRRLGNSELPLNKDGSIYHLALHPEDVADIIIIAGDPERARMISSFFETIRLEKSNREFHTFTGIMNGKEITTMSTGIGTDNIDIVLNELDALKNIDLVSREIKAVHSPMQIVRLGTCGALQEDIEVDSMVSSKYGLGLDGLLNYYNAEYTKIEVSIRDAFIYHTSYPIQWAKPYIVEGDQDLRIKIAYDSHSGITATAAGFYGPQGRELRLDKYHPDMNELMTSFKFDKERIVNYEMETSALYGLARNLGHSACTVCTVLANRLRKEKSTDYKSSVKTMVETILGRLTE